MADIVLATLNAKYIHASFGLRYLHANLGELKDSAEILEFQTTDRILEVAESILSRSPKLVGIGIYIWNAKEATKLARLLKQIAPDVIIVGGGPEISYETDEQEISQYLDYIIQGEGDLAFKELCEGVFLRGEKPLKKIITAAVPDVETLTLPYSLYTDNDIENRIVYVEASRGCPFTCEFCLSSLEIPVRAFSLERMLPEFESLLKRGVKHFKFVDRTFNLNIKTSTTILEFFLARYHPGLFLHFEMIPDRLPVQLRELLSKFPEGALQFEVGIQSFNPEVNKLISRRQDFTKLADNISFLTQQTMVHIHADLIAGLPGEDMASFGRGFDELVKLAPQEIQMGILKRLRGTPIVRHNEEWGMVYDQEPPYEILKTKLVTFADMQRLKRFARYWDIVANSGNFKETNKLLLHSGHSAFYSFLGFSDWLWTETGRRHGISLKAMAEFLWRYMSENLKLDSEQLLNAISQDFSIAGRSDLPEFLSKMNHETVISNLKVLTLPVKRQSRHLRASPE